MDTGRIGHLMAVRLFSVGQQKLTVVTDRYGLRIQTERMQSRSSKMTRPCWKYHGFPTARALRSHLVATRTATRLSFGSIPTEAAFSKLPVTNTCQYSS